MGKPHQTLFKGLTEHSLPFKWLLSRRKRKTHDSQLEDPHDNGSNKRLKEDVNKVAETARTTIKQEDVQQVFMHYDF